MARKIVSLVILLSFLQLNISCVLTYQKTKAVKLVRRPPSGDVQVSRVEKMSGEQITFSKGRPGRLAGDKFCLTSEKSIQKQIDKADIRTIYIKRGRPSCIVTKGGTSYEVVRVLSQAKDHLVILTYDPEGTVIALSEVRYIWIKKTNYWLSALVVIVPIAAFLVVLSGFNLAMDLGGLGSAFSGGYPRY
jgi:hypothetical protein